MPYLDRENNPLLYSERFQRLGDPVQSALRQSYRVIDKETFLRIGCIGILYGITTDKSIGELFHYFNVSTEEVQGDIKAARGITILPEIPPEAPQIFDWGILDDTLSGTARDVFRIANNLAKRSGVEGIGPESLLIGLVFEGTSRAADLLEARNITADRLLRFGQLGSGDPHIT